MLSHHFWLCNQNLLRLPLRWSGSRAQSRGLWNKPAAAGLMPQKPLDGAAEYALQRSCPTCGAAPALSWRMRKFSRAPGPFSKGRRVAGRSQRNSYASQFSPHRGGGGCSQRPEGPHSRPRGEGARAKPDGPEGPGGKGEGARAEGAMGQGQARRRPRAAHSRRAAHSAAQGGPSPLARGASERPGGRGPQLAGRRRSAAARGAPEAARRAGHRRR